MVPLTLRLEQEGDTVSGYILEVPRGQAPVAGRVSGGTASLEGRTVVVPDITYATLDVRQMSLYHVADGSVAGSLHLVSDQRTVYLDIQGEIVSTLRHSPLPAITDYSGTWQGNYVVRACVSDTRDSCVGNERVGSGETFELVIDDSKTIRLGIWPRWSLSGTSGLNGLDLHSQELELFGGSLTITRFNAVRNRVGQLNGTLTYVRRDRYPDGRVDTRTADIELVYVVQVR